MEAVGRSANRLVEEIRRQFREIKGLLEGKAEPQIDRCVEIATKGAVREMIIPGVPIGSIEIMHSGALPGVRSNSTVSH